jgi:hypothetical protein
MGRKSRNFRQSVRRRGLMPSPEPPPEYVPRTESEEARRAMRDWLRDRDEDDVCEFEPHQYLGAFLVLALLCAVPWWLP